MNSELELLVKLKHPHPEQDPEGFINSLSDEYVEKYLYRFRNYSPELKRAKAISYLKNRIDKNSEYTDMMWNRLARHYKENEL